MIKYLFASHGEFSLGTKSFLKIMMGGVENIYTITAFLDEESIESKFRNILEEIGEFDQLIIFCDLHGGSVAQEVYRQTQSNVTIHTIAGYNVALALDLILKGQDISKDSIRASVSAAKEAIVYLNDYKCSTEEEDLF